MESPADPPDEIDRLSALWALDLLDTPAEERFDRLTRLAKRVFQAPIALVSLVDAERQWFKSNQGLMPRETPRTLSFCGHTILDDAVLVVEDTREDRRFCDNPLVTDDPNIRFYAGYPLKTPEGHRVGTLCVIDRQPRTFDADAVALLRDLGMLVEHELAQHSAHAALLLTNEFRRRQALIDDLTMLWNRRGILEVLRSELAHARRADSRVVVAMLDLDHFKQINDRYGHPAGDVVLREVAQRLRARLRTEDAIGRFGGEEFLLVCRAQTGFEGLAACQRLCQSVSSAPIVWGPHSLSVTASVGVARGNDGAEALIAEADAALYRAKNGGRNRVVAAWQNDTAIPASRRAVG